MLRTIRSATAVAGLLLSSLAFAQGVQVRVEDASGNLLQGTFLAPGQAWTGILPTATRRVKLLPTSTSVDIGRIVLYGGPVPGDVDISIGGPFAAASVTPVPAGRNLAGIIASELSSARLYGAIAGSVTGDILVSKLSRFEAAGTLQGQFYADNTYMSLPALLRVGAISSSSVVTLNAGTLDWLDVSSGSMAGQVTLANGSLNSMTVAGNFTGKLNVPQGAIGRLVVAGDINNVSPPGALWPVRARNGINFISAGAINAQISTGADGGLGTLGFLQTTRGDFSGAIYSKGVVPVAGQPESGMRIARHLYAYTDLRDRDVNAMIKIGGSLFGQLVISDADGLKGQCIINANNSNSAWTGSVTIGGLDLLSPKPTYFNHSTQFGGGDVGLAPFALHFEDCIPAGARPPLNPTTCGYFVSAFVPAPPSTVFLDHYGPVEFSPGTGIGMRIFRRAVGTCAWSDVSSDFSASPNANGNNRMIRVDALPGHNGFRGLPGSPTEFLIKPILLGVNLKILRCQDVVNTPPVRDYNYILSVPAGPGTPPPPPPPPPPPGAPTKGGTPVPPVSE